MNISERWIVTSVVRIDVSLLLSMNCAVAVKRCSLDRLCYRIRGRLLLCDEDVTFAAEALATETSLERASPPHLVQQPSSTPQCSNG